MTITKNTEVFKIDTTDDWAISVRTDTVIFEDGVEISRTSHRHCLVPFFSSKNSEGAWVHTPTDLSDQEDSVRAVADALWTDTAKAKYKAVMETG